MIASTIAHENINLCFLRGFWFIAFFSEEVGTKHFRYEFKRKQEESQRRYFQKGFLFVCLNRVWATNTLLTDSVLSVLISWLKSWFLLLTWSNDRSVLSNTSPPAGFSLVHKYRVVLRNWLVTLLTKYLYNLSIFSIQGVPVVRRGICRSLAVCSVSVFLTWNWQFSHCTQKTSSEMHMLFGKQSFYCFNVSV